MRVLIPALLLLLTALPLQAQVSVSQGGGGCSMLVHTLTSRWFDVKELLVPAGEELKKVKRQDFICLDPRVVRGSIERRSVVGISVRCFRGSGGSAFGFCCDDQLASCAQLHPGLFPELQPTRGEQRYEPSKSDWVRPPSDSEQWSTND